MSEKWALPSSAKEQIWTKGRSRAPGGSVHLFFRSFDRVDDFSPGHPGSV